MEKKVKVLQVVGQLRIGGAETVAMNIYRYIDRDRFEFNYLVYGSSVGDYEREVYELGGKVIHMEYSFTHFRKFKKDLVNVLSENGPYDIIHAHMMFHNGIILKIAEKEGIPIRVSHSHSTNDGGVRNNGLKNIIRAIYLKYMRKLIQKNANMILACGEAAGVYLYGEKTYHRRGILVQNGINIDKYQFNESVRENMRIENSLNGKRVYASIGHFDRVKNHFFLIELFEKICLIDKDAVLVLLGDGKLRPDIERLCKEKNLCNKVIFKGNVNNVNEWMQAIDFLLMPSLYEGIPVTLVEAQAAGLKCFASDKISKEVNVTKRIKYIPLDVVKWTCIANERTDYDRVDNVANMLFDSGYSIKNNIKKIESEYIKMKG